MNTPTNTTNGTDSIWYIEKEGARKGPYSDQEMVSMIESGKVTRETLYWQKGMKEWQPLSHSALEHKFGDHPPALTGSAVPNGLVWTVAFAPLIGQFLAGMAAALARTSIDKFWWITLALNIGLTLLDEKKLKAAGHDTSGMGMAWLVPVYLYKRAEKLKQSMAYFFVWVICLVLSLVV